MFDRIRSRALGFVLACVCADPAAALSCADVPYGDRVTSTAAIIVARITGGEVGAGGGTYGAPILSTFDLVETIEGDIEFDTLRADSGASWGPRLVVGGKYILYLNAAGALGPCARVLELSSPDRDLAARAHAELAALRISRDSAFTDLDAPWFYRGGEGNELPRYCHLEHHIGRTTPARHSWASAYLNLRTRITADPDGLQVDIHWEADVQLLRDREQEGAFDVTLDIVDQRFPLHAIETTNSFRVNVAPIGSADAMRIYSLLESNAEIRLDFEHPVLGPVAMRTDNDAIGPSLGEFRRCLSAPASALQPEPRSN